MSTDRLAPPKFLPCPRCGATTFTRHEVKIHDDWHKTQDDRDKRLVKAMNHLEQFLAAVEFEPDPETGETQTFTGWMTDTDDILETLTTDVEALKKAGPATAAPFVLEAGEWPTDVSSEPEEPTEDEDAGLAAVLTSGPTDPPDDDLEDPTSDPEPDAATVATVFGAPVTYGQTGVIA